MRIGIGYDIHRLKKGRDLFLGGIQIPFSLGLVGHSDGDVLLHAVCDAILGAANLGDIGQHFPDTEPKYQGIASSELLIEVYELIKNKGYSVNNIDVVVIAEEPKLGIYKSEIQNHIARLLGIEAQRISIKAKTNEGLGETGSKKAIACFAVVSLTIVA